MSNLNQNIIQGDDLMCWADASVVGYASSVSLTLSTATTTVSNKDAGNGWESLLATTKSWTATTEHLYAQSVYTGEKTYDDLFAAWSQGTPLTLDFALNQNGGKTTGRIADVDDTSAGWTQNGNIYEGQALITSLALTGKNGESATYTVEFKGSGEIKKKALA